MTAAHGDKAGLRSGGSPDGAQRNPGSAVASALSGQNETHHRPPVPGRAKLRSASTGTVGERPSLPGMAGTSPMTA
jgi:hypothetical protein